MTILQTTTMSAPVPLLMFAALICFIVTFAITVAYIDFDVAGWIATIVGSLGLILLVLSLVITKETTRYQVLLDDTYSVSELYENYEIVEQEGITYWIEEK